MANTLVMTGETGRGYYNYSSVMLFTVCNCNAELRGYASLTSFLPVFWNSAHSLNCTVVQSTGFSDSQRAGSAWHTGSLYSELYMMSNACTVHSSDGSRFIRYNDIIPRLRPLTSDIGDKSCRRSLKRQRERHWLLWFENSRFFMNVE